MRPCAYCGSENDDSAGFCSRCGTPLNEDAPREPQARRILYLDPVARFRVLIVTSWIAYLLVLVGPWVFWSNLSTEASDVLSWRGLDAILPLTGFPYYLLSVLWLAAAVGIYFFINAARALYAALAAFNLLVFLLGGMDTRLAVESFLIQFTTMADGAIIAIAYWSPLSKKFETDSGSPRETPTTSADERRSSSSQC